MGKLKALFERLIKAVFGKSEPSPEPNKTRRLQDDYYERDPDLESK